MSLKAKILEDLKDAMRAVDDPNHKPRLSAIRMLKAEIMNAEIAKKGELTDDEIISIIQKQIKIRNEAIEQYEKGGRQDLVDNERKEAEVLSKYLPKQLTDEEIKDIVEEAIKETGATSVKEMGKVMSYVMPKVKGKADGKRVNQIVSEALKD